VEGVAKFMGVEYLAYYDIGVAGMHRLIEPLKEIRDRDVDAIVVLAGMEGALPTLVASLVDIPVIGVPIPIGYGYGGNGETALASMLQSCAPGLSVMNIGNGFGAGAFACLIAQRRKK
jgi:NCAIR mutase (PurE)-related protein